MDKAREITGLTEKISLGRLINLMDHFELHANPNLLPGTNDWSGVWDNKNLYSDSGAYQGQSVLKASHAWLGISEVYEAEAGKTYTFSAYVKSDVRNNAANIFVLPNVNTFGATPYQKRDIAVDNDWKRVSLTFKTTEAVSLRPRIETSDASTIYICGYKLEEGDLATPLSEVGGS